MRGAVCSGSICGVEAGNRTRDPHGAWSEEVAGCVAGDERNDDADWSIDRDRQHPVIRGGYIGAGFLRTAEWRPHWNAYGGGSGHVLVRARLDDGHGRARLESPGA